MFIGLTARFERINQGPKARVSIDEAEASGRKVIDAKHLNHAFGGRAVVEDFSIKVMRGDHIGIITADNVFNVKYGIQTGAYSILRADLSKVYYNPRSNAVVDGVVSISSINLTVMIAPVAPIG